MEQPQDSITNLLNDVEEAMGLFPPHFLHLYSGDKSKFIVMWGIESPKIPKIPGAVLEK